MRLSYSSKFVEDAIPQYVFWFLIFYPILVGIICFPPIESKIQNKFSIKFNSLLKILLLVTAGIATNFLT